jgi:hypothetical protein
VRGQDKIDVRNLNIGDWEVVKELITNDGLNNTLITNNYYNNDGVVSQLKLTNVNPTLFNMVRLNKSSIIILVRAGGLCITSSDFSPWLTEPD